MAAHLLRKESWEFNHYKGGGQETYSTLQSNMYPKSLAGGEFPFNVSVEGTNIHSSRYVDALSEVVDVF